MLNIKLLKEESEEIRNLARREVRDNIQEELLEFMTDSFFKEQIKNRKHKIGDMQSSRVLNHWESEGLINIKKNKETGRREFSRLDSIWVQLINCLRDFGLSLGVIKDVRDVLYKKKFGGFTPFEYAIMYTVMQEPMMLLVFNEEEPKLLPKSLYAKYLKEMNLSPHVSVNLISILKSEFPQNNFDSTEVQRIVLDNISDKELQLLYLLRTGEFDSVKVTLKDGEVSLIEGTQKIDRREKIIDLINAHDYQSIEIRVLDGNVIKINQTIQVKP